MARKETKSSEILNGAKQRLEDARTRVQIAKNDLAMAQVAFDVHETYCELLTAQLTPKPRKKSEKPSTSPQAAKEPTADKEPLCGACGNVADYQDHLKPSPQYHKFDAPKSTRKPRQKKDAPTLIPVDSEGVDGNGLAAEMEN